MRREASSPLEEVNSRHLYRVQNVGTGNGDQFARQVGLDLGVSVLWVETLKLDEQQSAYIAPTEFLGKDCCHDHSGVPCCLPIFMPALIPYPLKPFL